MGIEPIRAGPQPAVPPQHFGPVIFGRPGRLRSCIFALSRRHSTTELLAVGAGDGIRTHDLLVGNEPR